jgi:FixJ family two-component response regulator
MSATESECVHCNATDEPEHGVVIGNASAVEKSVCTICYAEKLQEMTVLSEMESQVQSHKRVTGASHETIADRLDLSKSTVDTYSLRIQEKVEKAAQTKKMVGFGE